MITNTSTGTASASTETPLQASIVASPPSPPPSAPLAPPAPAWAASLLRSMGRPLQASPETGTLPVLALPVVPAVPLVLPPVPVLLVLPALPAEVAEPPLLERVPALPVAFGLALGSMVLPCGSLQATAMPTSNVAKQAMELERLRMFFSLHRLATVNDIDASRAFALDAVTSVAC